MILPVGRPVLAKDQAVDLVRRILSMTTAKIANVQVKHEARVVTRMASNRISDQEMGDDLQVRLSLAYGELWTGWMNLGVNQLDDVTLRAMVARCEAIARQRAGNVERVFPDRKSQQDTFPSVQLWHEETVEAMLTAQDNVVPATIAAAQSDKLNAAGSLTLWAQVHAMGTRDGILAVSEQTDSEFTVTARNNDGTASGWHGEAARNWAEIRPEAVIARAIEMARMNANPVAIEPGRRTAIFSSEAVAQMLRLMPNQYDAYMSDIGETSFSRTPSGNKRGMRVFDPRITLRSDPADPEGGYAPYFERTGLASPAMTWVEKGVLRNLAYTAEYAMARGKQYALQPKSIRMSGGDTSIEEMIAQCKEGVYVNRISGVDIVSRKSCLLSGVTRDGCFLVKDGKIAKPVKNLRFLDSPFFFLNAIEAMGTPRRAAFGFMAPSAYERTIPWPLDPIIAPPIMVRDFNFVAVADAI